MENFDEVFPDDNVEIDGEEQVTDTAVSKCPSCGSNMVFSPEKKCLECEYCGTTAEVDLSKYSYELDFSKLLDPSVNTWGAETHVFRCTNCGAKEILSKKEIVKNCSFCGTSNVVETDELSGLKPNAVIPFSIDKSTACTNVIAWAKKKFFAPKKFKESVRPEKIKGNYTPAFTFDSMTSSAYHGRLGIYYYETRRVNGKTVQVRKTRWFNISGRVNSNFDDILVKASDAVPQADMNKIVPFTTNASQEYSEEFLHGFSASQYSSTGLECWGIAKQTIRSSIRNQILRGYTYNVVGSLNIDTTYHKITYKYILLPVYVGHCKYTEKNYNFFVNGQNGKVSGKTPLSWLKIALLSLLGIAVVGGLIAIVILTG